MGAICIWEAYEASGQLWQSFSRNDAVAPQGRVQDVTALVATAEVCAEQEQEVANAVTLVHEHMRNGTTASDDDEDDDEELSDNETDVHLAPFTRQGLALAMPAGAGPALLPQFLPPVGAAMAGAAAAASMTAAKAAHPAARRKCTVCGAEGHRADNQAYAACYAANKKTVAAKKAALADARAAAKSATSDQ